MRAARASISQCGYNTALDLVVSEVPALVVPYGTVTENEQRHRAQRLAALGAVLCFDENTALERRVAGRRHRAPAALLAAACCAGARRRRAQRRAAGAIDGAPGEEGARIGRNLRACALRYERFGTAERAHARPDAAAARRAAGARRCLHPRRRRRLERRAAAGAARCDAAPRRADRPGRDPARHEPRPGARAVQAHRCSARAARRAPARLHASQPRNRRPQVRVRRLARRSGTACGSSTRPGSAARAFRRAPAAGLHAAVEPLHGGHAAAARRARLCRAVARPRRQAGAARAAGDRRRYRLEQAPARRRCSVRGRSPGQRAARACRRWPGARPDAAPRRDDARGAGVARWPAGRDGRHPRVRWRAMRELLAPTTNTTRRPAACTTSA